jgi:hypothetical protein
LLHESTPVLISKNKNVFVIKPIFMVCKSCLQRRKRWYDILCRKFTPGIYLACSDLKLSVPGDVKVISFTILQTAAIPEPPLITVTQPAIVMGKVAALALFKRLLKNSAYQKMK